MASSDSCRWIGQECECGMCSYCFNCRLVVPYGRHRDAECPKCGQSLRCGKSFTDSAGRVVGQHDTPLYNEFCWRCFIDKMNRNTADLREHFKEAGVPFPCCTSCRSKLDVFLNGVGREIWFCGSCHYESQMYHTCDDDPDCRCQHSYYYMSKWTGSKIEQSEDIIKKWRLEHKAELEDVAVAKKHQERIKAAAVGNIYTALEDEVIA